MKLLLQKLYTPYLTRKLTWIALGFIALVLRFSGTNFIEFYYSRGLFLGVRWSIDTFLSWWLPFPILYLFIVTLVTVLIIRIRSFFRWRAAWQEKVYSAVLSVFAFLGGALFFFLFLWGYNYGRQPIEAQLGLKLEPLGIEEIWEELQLETDKLIKEREQIVGATDEALAAGAFPLDQEKKLRANLEQWLLQEGFPTTGSVRAKNIYPKGIFLHFSSSGLYFPYTGEGHVDAGLSPLMKPYVLTHEMGHGYGFGDEGTCNFLAYVACIQAEDPILAYCGRLSYWRTVAINFKRYKPEEYQAFRDQLPLGIQNDLDAINENLLSYPDFMPEVRYAAYNTYLKAQGISEGIQNYNRVLMMVHAWRQKRRI